MLTAPTPPNEAERLRALVALDVLDSEPEVELDALVAAAALVCGVPISLVSLIDADRQWFKANIGLEGVAETPREVAFCAHAILQDGIFEVPDATQDARFVDNPLVTSAPDIRFYAGATLRLSDGAHVGTLCVIDRKPRTLTPTQREVLAHLARAAAQALEQRRLARGFVISEARFRALSEGSPLGVFATDAEGECIYTNTRWQSIHGLSPAQALGRGWMQSLHPDDQAAVYAQWQSCATLQIDFDMEFRLMHPDSGVRHVRSVSRAVLDESGTVKGYVGSVEDVTERRADERRLRNSEQMLNRTGALAQVGGWELDLRSGDLVWTDQTCLIHGVEPGYKPQLNEAIEFYAPRARPLIQAAVERAMQTGESWDLELPFVQMGGREIWVRAVGQAEVEQGVPVRLMGTFQDITQRVEQRIALEAVHDRMALATESGGIGVWEFDVRQRAFLWDERMCRLYGLPGEHFVKPYEFWLAQVHPEDRKAAEQSLRDAVWEERALDTEFRTVWSDGSVHHLRASARPKRDEQDGTLRMVGVTWDVTPARQMAAELAEKHELLHVTMQSIGDAVITTDAEGRVTWLNPVAEHMTGWLCANAVGMPSELVFRVLHEETREPAESPVALCLARGTISGLASRSVVISRSGAEFAIEDSAAPIRNAAGDLLGAVLVFHDVTEQRRLSGEMNYRATHDALTGLVNRSEFETRLQRTLESAQEEDSQHAMMFIDLDQFKLVNDACGHTVGDQLLQQVAKRMAQSVRSGDTLARLGGDEFAVILEKCTTDQAQRVAQQICERMDDFRFTHDGQRFRIGASIGLVPVDKRWTSLAAVMQAADSACYAAKDAGRNRVHTWFDADQLMRARHGEMQWATRLEQALDEDRFVLYAQRIEPLAPGEAGLHAEVLIRLKDTDGSLIPPGAFLPAAERFHLATRIDRWVLAQAIAKLQSLASLASIDMLCVNLSGHSIGDRAFHRHAMATLTSAGPDICERLCLEITETAAVTNMADAAVFVEQVRAQGVRIALDDFGAGASSFGYLKTLKVDVLKIDGQFIKDLLDDRLDDAAVRCFVDVARVLGLKTVAEFVDRADIQERVRQLGIDYAQGYLLHRPESFDNVLTAASTMARTVA